MQDPFCSTGSFHAFFTPALSQWCVQMMVYISHWNTQTHTHTGRNTFPLLSVEDGYLGQIRLSVCVRRPLGVFPWWPSHSIIYGEVFYSMQSSHIRTHTQRGIQLQINNPDQSLQLPWQPPEGTSLHKHTHCTHTHMLWNTQAVWHWACWLYFTWPCYISSTWRG